MINNLYGTSQFNIRPDLSGTDIQGRQEHPQEGQQSYDVMQSLKGGDTITGQIVARSGSEVQISLGGDSVISAHLNATADLPVGSSVTFTVMSSDSSGTVLSPLLTNTNMTSSLNTALLNAGLNVDERNMSMVSSMMERGMSISKEEVLMMSQSLSALPDAEVGEGVLLKSLGIEPTADNIEQFHAYQGYEHQVSSAVNEIMDMVPQTIASMIESGDTGAAISMTRDILDIFTGQGAIEHMDETGLKLSGMEAPINMILSGSELTELADLLTENGIDPMFAESMANGEVSLNDIMFILDDIVNSGATAREAAADTDILQTEEQTLFTPGPETARDGADTQPAAGAGADPSTGKAISDTVPETNTAAPQTTGSAGLDFLSALKNENVNAGNLDEAINTANEVNSRAVTHGILKLIQSRPMSVILQKAVEDQWKLTPGQVSEDKQVSDLYKRMTEQTGRILNALNNHSSQNSALSESVNELSKNMNFMNELNNMFNYIQLPMKFAGNEAHGELYVYSNKKHLASNDGTVSALLHLDMDHLGPTDVYVTMNQANHVNTHFYLPDDEALDLIAAHIDELNERINSRGYTCTAEFSMREEMTNVMNEIMEDNKSHVPISVSNFDARA